MSTETSIIVAVIVVLLVLMAVLGAAEVSLDEVEKDLFKQDNALTNVEKNEEGETQFKSVEPKTGLLLQEGPKSV